MNYGQLKELLLRDVLPDHDVPEQVPGALRFTHREVQRIRNWRAMEHRVEDLAYAAALTTGITVAADYKMARNVWLDTAGVLSPIQPTDEAEANRLRRATFQARAATDLTTTHHQRWYEAGLKVVLLVPPAAQLTLVVDYWRYLAFYEDVDVGDEGEPATVEDATDWFSDNIPEALAWGAAYFLTRFAKDKAAEAKHYREMYQQLRDEAWQADLVARQGGVAGALQPPRRDPVQGGPE